MPAFDIKEFSAFTGGSASREVYRGFSVYFGAFSYNQPKEKLAESFHGREGRGGGGAAIRDSFMFFRSCVVRLFSLPDVFPPNCAGTESFS